MQNTTNYNLKKPDYTDFADIADINDNMDTIDAQLAAPTGDSADSTTTFTTSDTADGSASSWTTVPALTSGETHKSLFAKMSQMFKNIRFLYKLLGTTDISSIGNGTVTGGLSSLNDSLANLPRLDTVTTLTQASQLTRAALGTLPLGTYIVQCASASDFPVASAYGVLIHYGNLNSYHAFMYVDSAYAYTYTIHYNGASINNGWHWGNVWHNDVTLSITQGGAAQINLNSGNVINYTTFINGYVINTNNIVAQFYTYSNLIYVKLYTDQGTAAPAGTYTIRCIFGQLA